MGHTYYTNSLNGSDYKYLQKPKHVQKRNLQRIKKSKPHSLVALEHLKLRRKLHHPQLFWLINLGCLQQGEELNLLAWKTAFAYCIGFLLFDLECLQQGEEMNLLTWKKVFVYFIGFLLFNRCLLNSHLRPNAHCFFLCFFGRVIGVLSSEDSALLIVRNPFLLSNFCVVFSWDLLLFFAWKGGLLTRPNVVFSQDFVSSIARNGLLQTCADIFFSWDLISIIAWNGFFPGTSASDICLFLTLFLFPRSYSSSLGYMQ